MVRSPFLLSALLLIATTARAQEVFHVRADLPAQTLVGFGGSQAFYLEHWLDHPTPGLIHDLIFDGLKIDVLRLEMAYERPNGASATWEERMDRQVELLTEAALRGVTSTIVTSWSPPEYLKDNNELAGGTLARDGMSYQYDEYADWWAAGLLEYQTRGVEFDYLSPQNEPRWQDVYPTCRFDPLENEDYAGYAEMYTALHARLEQEPSLDPLLMSCDSAGYWDLWSYFVHTDPLPFLDAWSHHMYGIPWTEPNVAHPEQEVLQTYWGHRPIFQTEFSSLELPQGYMDAVHQAHHMHNVLVEEGAAAYLFWGLVWRDGATRMDGLLQVRMPVLKDPEIVVRECYWGFKHFSAHLGAGDQRVECEDLGATELLVSTYRRVSDGVLVAVLINPTEEDHDVELDFTGFLPGEVTGFLTTAAGWYQPATGLSATDSFTLPAESILTLEIEEAVVVCEYQPTCVGVANSTGFPASLAGSGSTSIAANDLSFSLSDCPPNQFGTMFFGQGQASVPMGNGLRCVEAPLYRMSVAAIDENGLALVPFDALQTGTLAEITAGSTWEFQFWYRDFLGGGAMNSVSSGLQVTFCP